MIATIETIPWDTLMEESQAITEKEERYWQEIEDCGTPITTQNPRTGKYHTYPHRQCKHYKDCPKCANWKRHNEKNSLTPLIGTVRYLECSQDEENKITRKYGAKNIRRIPLEDGRTAFIIQTDEQIGEVFNDDHCQKMADNSIPKDDRRVSGKLGQKQVVVAKKSEEKVEQTEVEINLEELWEALENPDVKVSHRRIKLAYDSDDPNAPQCDQDLNRMVADEAPIYDNPNSSIQELENAMEISNETVEKICTKFGMSFNLYSYTISVLKLNEVDWKWTRNKRPPG